MNFIKKIKKIEFFYKKVLTKKNSNDTISTVKKIERKEGAKMSENQNIIDFSKIDDQNIIFDFSKLRGKIKEIYGTQTAFATAMSMNEATLSNKLNNNVEFSPKEIVKACNLLNINLRKVDLYFFSSKVQKNEQK